MKEDGETRREPGRRSNLRISIPLSICVGATVYFLVVQALGVTIEVWEGINTFTNLKWFAAATAAPALSGFVTGLISGHNGKWFGVVPVLLMHPSDYFQARALAGGDVMVLGFGLFVFFMLVMMELALMAGWGGELLRRRISGEQLRA